MRLSFGSLGVGILLASSAVFAVIDLTVDAPSITQGINVVDRAAAIELMTTRLQAEFPVGSPSKRLVGVLEREGFAVSFSLEDWERADHTSGLICPARWSILWKVDRNSILTDVRADWDNPCY